MEPEPRSEGVPDSVRAVASTLRSRRHAEMLFETVTSRLGDDGWHETRNRGAIRQLFRRDPAQPGWLVPWPVLELNTGGRFGVVSAWIPVGDAPVGQPTPRRPVPPRLRRLGPGEIRIVDGPEYIAIVYNDEGAKFETCSSHRNALAQLAPALADTSANPVDLLASFVAGLDPGRHGPARVRLPVPLPHGASGVWHRGRRALRCALFEDRVPRDTRWVVADGLNGSAFGFGTTRDEALANWSAAISDDLPWPDPKPASTPPPEPELGDGTIVVRAPEPDVPLPDAVPGNVPAVLVPIEPRPTERPRFGSWTTLLGERGATSFAARRRHARGFTLIGRHVLDVVDLGRLDAEIAREDGVHEERMRAVYASAPGGVVRRPLRTVDYEVVGQGRLSRRSSSEGPDWDAGNLDGDVVAQRIVRQRFVE